MAYRILFTHFEKMIVPIFVVGTSLIVLTSDKTYSQPTNSYCTSLWQRMNQIPARSAYEMQNRQFQYNDCVNRSRQQPAQGYPQYRTQPYTPSDPTGFEANRRRIEQERLEEEQRNREAADRRKQMEIQNQVQLAAQKNALIREGSIFRQRVKISLANHLLSLATSDLSKQVLDSTIRIQTTDAGQPYVPFLRLREFLAVLMDNTKLASVTTEQAEFDGVAHIIVNYKYPSMPTKGLAMKVDGDDLFPDMWVQDNRGHELVQWTPYNKAFGIDIPSSIEIISGLSGVSEGAISVGIPAE